MTTLESIDDIGSIWLRPAFIFVLLWIGIAPLLYQPSIYESKKDDTIDELGKQIETIKHRRNDSILILSFTLILPALVVGASHLYLKHSAKKVPLWSDKDPMPYIYMIVILLPLSMIPLFLMPLKTGDLQSKSVDDAKKQLKEIKIRSSENLFAMSILLFIPLLVLGYK